MKDATCRRCGLAWTGTKSDHYRDCAAELYRQREFVFNRHIVLGLEGGMRWSARMDDKRALTAYGSSKSEALAKLLAEAICVAQTGAVIQ
jgi:hypothetical protein